MYTNLYILSHFLEFSQPYIQIVIIISIGVFRSIALSEIPYLERLNLRRNQEKWFLLATCMIVSQQETLCRRVST